MMSLLKRFFRIGKDIIYKYALSDLNLMSEKSLTSNIVETIPTDSKFEVIDEEEEWIKAIYKGKIGYIDKKFVSITKYAWSNLNLRQDKNTVSNVIDVIPKKYRVEVLEVDGDWSKVIYNDKKGYVFNYFLSDDGNDPGKLDYSNFYTDINKFISDNNIKSPTDYLMITDLKNKYTYVFKKNEGKFVQLYKWRCTVGKPSTPTIKGTFYINGRKPSFGTNLYMAKYATRIKGGYYYHSILYNSTGKYVIDSRLGQALSHGCIRLQTVNAKWVYENIPDKTTVIIY